MANPEGGSPSVVQVRSHLSGCYFSRSPDGNGTWSSTKLILSIKRGTRWTRLRGRPETKLDPVASHEMILFKYLSCYRGVPSTRVVELSGLVLGMQDWQPGGWISKSLRV